MVGNFSSDIAGAPAVMATASVDNGVDGISTGADRIGVFGNNDQVGGVGVWGTADNASGKGIVGFSENGIGVHALGSHGIPLNVEGSGAYNAPTVKLNQDLLQDFARIRFATNGCSVWDIAVGGPTSVFNVYSEQTATNILTLETNGNVTTSGSLHQHSSRASKENIEELSTDDALQALEMLKPVQFSYKQDAGQTRRLGFIAEDLPPLVASQDRTKICVLDIVTVLATALQKQLAVSKSLAERVSSLEDALASAG